MGKKPLLGIFGLFWAGVALTGAACDCCRNNNNKYRPEPSWPVSGPKGQPPAGGASVTPVGGAQAKDQGTGQTILPTGGRMTPPAPDPTPPPSGISGYQRMDSSGAGQLTGAAGTSNFAVPPNQVGSPLRSDLSGSSQTAGRPYNNVGSDQPARSGAATATGNDGFSRVVVPPTPSNLPSGQGPGAMSPMGSMGNDNLGPPTR
jgi:hypothetical protein